MNSDVRRFSCLGKALRKKEDKAVAEGFKGHWLLGGPVRSCPSEETEQRHQSKTSVFDGHLFVLKKIAFTETSGKKRILDIYNTTDL